MDFENFMNILLKKSQKLKQTSIEECDVILDFCPIVSRAGTDIDAAIKRLNRLQVDKPVILVVLHHTFDPEKVIPDSNVTVNREQTLAVDCLFYEDKGLLQCQRNYDAVDKITEYLKSQKLTSYACLKDPAHARQISDQDVHPRQTSDQDAENRPLMSATHSKPDQASRKERFLNWLKSLCCLNKPNSE